MLVCGSGKKKSCIMIQMSTNGYPESRLLCILEGHNIFSENITVEQVSLPECKHHYY